MTTDSKPRPPQIRKCKHCDGLTYRVHPIEIDGEVIEVGRCTVCDTKPCPKCDGRTINPTATKCKHCGEHIGLISKKGDSN